MLDNKKNKLKILLVYPSCRWIKGWEARTIWDLHPYNLCLLAAAIGDKYDVDIFDANIDKLDIKDFEKIIKEKKPDVLGISVLTNEYGQSAVLAAETAKKVNKNIKTIVGGVYATVSPENIIKSDFVDFVVVGEGEFIFKQMCDYFSGEGELPEKGIMYKKEGKIISTKRAPFIEDLDFLPFPLYEKVDFLKYATTIQRESVDRPRALPYAHILTSRGCPYNCCFCEVEIISGKKPRCRSPENIFVEIEYLVKKYGIKSFIIDDDNLLVYRDRAKKFFELLIEKKLNLKWNAIALAVFKLDEELIKLMKKSGCEYVNIAIESGVNRILKDIIGKPIDLELAKKLVKKLKEAKIDVAVNFIIGFPGETWSEIRQSLKFAEIIDADYTKIFIATPLPKTRLYNMAKEQSALVKGFGFDKHLWTNGWIETDEFRPEDLKMLRAYEWDRINFTDPKKKRKIAKMMDITEEKLDLIRKQTFVRANPSKDSSST